MKWFERIDDDTLLGKLLFALPVTLLCLVLFSLPMGDKGGDWRLGLMAGGFSLAMSVFECARPHLKTWLLKQGVPAWSVTKGWRSSVIVGLLWALGFTVFLNVFNDGVDWLMKLPIIPQFLFFFGLYLAMFLALPWLWKRFMRTG